MNCNTLETFKSCDKQKIIKTAGEQIWDAISSGKAIEETEVLARFVMLTFADLKRYIFYYWFAFPCLNPGDLTLCSLPQHLSERFISSQINTLLTSYDALQIRHSTGFFMISEDKESLTVEKLSSVKTYLEKSQRVILGFADPSNLEAYPGWTLRNFLCLASYQWGEKLQQVEVVCLRDRSKDGSRDISHSLVFTVQLSPLGNLTECPKVLGWEKNVRGKLGPRMVDLSSSMDPTRLAESAVDLNLKLMRWRLLPELDLETVANTKCLLLGSGTLGCNVARCLLGWGVRTITLVDNGRISYSNPVRQSLFVFEDCTQGGQPKAEAAAAALQKIFPGVSSTGHSLSIPMPGHTVVEAALEQTREDVKRLEELIEQHDAVFLLMDTRESRWLPTLICAAKQKIVINAALGFDTYLVLRHGVKKDPAAPLSPPPGTSDFALWSKAIPGHQLGCYFCNDVVAPGNSTKDRTLDQQCTVSRPGMSMIASALAVELFVSVLQHPEKGLARAETSAKDEHLTKDFSSSLGLVPHQIRGFLSRFHNVLPASRYFDKCTACSKTVLDGYKAEGFDFLLKAFNQPSFLEDMTGLTQMYAETGEMEVWDLSDDESSSSIDT
ncbi:LOW QUALITY PROTEIN: ubiquitin-like modifier-activating enzyme ATG7 [Liolophura sinensis]|uniref:LOW QUALITY PROTEIN: ubiquitin-like modifier-activating enzyme ATG7 n=1 Tax=Liolophura sinensis TaxID=3198878 RepID=UPI003159567B